jgi:uncharacterized repeat protein (TIGR03803 family)
MTKRYPVIATAWLLHATSWFLPTVRGFLGSRLDHGIPGWEVFLSQTCAMRPCGDVSADPCSDGNFYGTAAAGGSNGFGTIFELTSGGAFNSLYSFFCTAASCSDGAIPYAGLLQGTNGTFYGTTSDGGDYRTSHNLGDGVAYSWSMGLGPFAEAQFNFGKTGQTVTILGNRLAGATSVTFNGVSANFKVISNTYLKAQIPTGATTGTIQVTTPNGTLNSNVTFQVLPWGNLKCREPETVGPNSERFFDFSESASCK